MDWFSIYYAILSHQTPLVGLKICSQQGLLSMFSALTRKISGTKIGKQDEQGMSLIHYAAIYNRPQIIILLLVQSVDINSRRNNIVASGLLIFVFIHVITTENSYSYFYISFN